MRSPSENLNYLLSWSVVLDFFLPLSFALSLSFRCLLIRCRLYLCLCYTSAIALGSLGEVRGVFH